ncbi:glycoside hydrolase family 73 protein [Marinilactibacillus sp. XAAS-LB27]|uniref:glycoside hydrolase family 73 protein n=1 Tax=Marinilactibacillus sp. XAAS-LB27 TaxID=3114538 RepID=UPI002E16E61A|nr:glycoside hydrolase family 73 protein [Marinilactibacillus sp. XAAS-LB27]
MAKRKTKARKRGKRNKQSPFMLLFKIGLVFLLFFVFSIAFVGKRLLDDPVGISSSREEEFIDEVGENAVILNATYGIRPSVAIAQAILESNWGRSELAQRENNYYGIKGTNETDYTTKEFEEDEWVEIRAEFRSYNTLLESMEDYAKLLKNGTEWDDSLYADVIESSNYRDAAKALKTAGYATDPDYPDKVISLIETYDLQRFDHDTNENEGQANDQ